MVGTPWEGTVNVCRVAAHQPLGVPLILYLGSGTTVPWNMHGVRLGGQAAVGWG